MELLGSSRPEAGYRDTENLGHVVSGGHGVSFPASPTSVFPFARFEVLTHRVGVTRELCGMCR
jgi:hypothetical protein